MEGKVVSLDHHNLVDVISIKSCTEARIIEAYLFMNLLHSLQPKQHLCRFKKKIYIYMPASSVV